jgi:hypothetical protein
VFGNEAEELHVARMNCNISQVFHGKKEVVQGNRLILLTALCIK